MEYIKKNDSPPADWDSWFTTGTGRRSYDYNTDSPAMRHLPLAKKYLLEEQNKLCAYCQKVLKEDEASIEHVIPKEFNVELSTSYFNLVAVCKQTQLDSAGNQHCDKFKQSKMIAPLIFTSASQVTATNNHKYFTANSDGSVHVRGRGTIEDKALAGAFIEVLNLNHTILAAQRKEKALYPLIAPMAGLSRSDKKKFMERQLRNILLDKKRQFRTFLLMYLYEKLGY